MTEEMFKKYRNYLLSVIDLAGIKPLKGEEFIFQIASITKFVFKGEKGNLYRPLTENEASLLWLEASIATSFNKPQLSYFKNPEEVVNSVDTSILESYPLISIFGKLTPNQIFGHLSAALSHDVIAEALRTGFLKESDDGHILSYTIENEDLYFTFHPIAVFEEQLKQPDICDLLKNNTEAVSKDFDLEKWNPSPSQMNN